MPIFDESSPVTPSPARAARVALNESHSLLPRQRVPSRHHLPEPDLRPRPWRRAAQHAGAALIQPRAKTRLRRPCRAGREYLVERAYRRSRDALCARHREGASRARSSSPRTAKIRCARFARPSTACWALQAAAMAMSMEEAAAEWGEGTAEDTMASNSRVRAVAARQLGWKPKARSLIEEIEQGVIDSLASISGGGYSGRPLAHPVPPRARSRHQLVIAFHHLHRRAQAVCCGAHPHFARRLAVLRPAARPAHGPTGSGRDASRPVARWPDRSRGRPSRTRP